MKVELEGSLGRSLCEGYLWMGEGEKNLKDGGDDETSPCHCRLEGVP